MTDVEKFVEELRMTSEFNFCTPEGWCLSPGTYSTCSYFEWAANGSDCRWRLMIRDNDYVNIPHCTCEDAMIAIKLEEI